MKSVLTVLCTLVLFLCSPNSPVSESFAKEKGADPREGFAAGAALEWEGSESEQADPFAGVITTDQDWDSLWSHAFGERAPRVDFRTSAVACVFLGHYPGWWYKIKIMEPYVEANSVIVPYELVSLVVEPQGVLNFGEQGSRGPYRMKVVKKKAGMDFTMKAIEKPQVPLQRPFPPASDK
jgi:hypothetical protein